MDTPYLSIGTLDDEFEVGQNWLFERLLGRLNANRHLILTADQGWGIQEYVYSLGFELSERNQDIQICYIDIKLAQSSASLQALFSSTLTRRFPEVIFRKKADNTNLDGFRLPEQIAHNKKMRIGVFLVNSHLLYRFRDPDNFLMRLKLILKRQVNVIICVSGNNNPNFINLIKHPGPLSGIGQWIQLNYDLLDQNRMARIRKIFHGQGKNLGYATSVHMSDMVDNHPFFLKLLAWHTFVKTNQTCDSELVEHAMDDLIHHFDYHFHKIVDQMTQKQLNYLKAILDGNQNISSKVTLEEYQLGSSGHISRIRQSLEKKEMIDRRYGEIVFTDPLFREWLRRKYFNDIK